MDVRRLLSTMALEVHSLTPVEASERIAHYARIAVDASDSGILLVQARGRLRTAAGTSDDVDKAHMLQGELGEGPCLDAARGGAGTYVTGDATNDPRWPAWGPRVAELGYRSVVSVRLHAGDRTYGSLNAYSASPDDFTPDDVEVMEYLGAHASAAIAASMTANDLTSALETRTLIGQAQGVLMAVYDLDSEGAFQYLRRLSMDGNTRLRDVAAEVVAQRHELRKAMA
jgi:GAF domain-containing protein